jgi:hypothetical protein
LTLTITVFIFSFFFFYSDIEEQITPNPEFPDLSNPDILMDYMIEVASAIKYKGAYVNRYSSKEEFEGVCGDYSTLFAIKTGAKLVITNQWTREKPGGNGMEGIFNGIYEIFEEDDPDVVIQFLGDANFYMASTIHQFYISYKYSNCIGIYNDGFGAWILRKVEDFEPRNSTTHVWNILPNGMEIDVTFLDTGGDWRVN